MVVLASLWLCLAVDTGFGLHAGIEARLCHKAANKLPGSLGFLQKFAGSNFLLTLFGFGLCHLFQHRHK